MRLPQRKNEPAESNAPNLNRRGWIALEVLQKRRRARAPAILLTSDGHGHLSWTINFIPPSDDSQPGLPYNTINIYKSADGVTWGGHTFDGCGLGVWLPMMAAGLLAIFASASVIGTATTCRLTRTPCIQMVCKYGTHTHQGGRHGQGGRQLLTRTWRMATRITTGICMQRHGLARRRSKGSCAGDGDAVD